MKKTFKNYIKLTLALVLFLQVGKVEAQVLPYTNLEGFSSIVSTTCNAATVGCLGTGPELMVNSNGAIVHGRWTNSYFNGPGVDAYIKTYFHATPYEIELELSDGTFTPKVAKLETDNIQITGSFPITYYGACSTTPTSFSIGCWYVPLDFAEFTIPAGKSVKGARITLGTVIPGVADLSKVVITSNALTCSAGSTPPTLSATTIANACPTTQTVNLNSLVTSTLPSGASLVWFTNNTRTGSPIATPTAVSTSGTYYAFYVDTVNNCYSPASAAVTATVTVCPVNITNTCPASSVDLALSLASTNVVPSGYTLTYHSGTPATTANKLTTSVVTTAGTYYGAYYLAGQGCYSATGRPLVVTFTDCCAAKIAPDLTN